MYHNKENRSYFHGVTTPRSQYKNKAQFCATTMARGLRYSHGMHTFKHHVQGCAPCDVNVLRLQIASVTALRKQYIGAQAETRQRHAYSQTKLIETATVMQKQENILHHTLNTKVVIHRRSIITGSSCPVTMLLAPLSPNHP